MSQPKHLIGNLYIWFKNYPSATFGMMQFVSKDGVVSTNDTRVGFEKVFPFVFKLVEPRVVNLHLPELMEYSSMQQMKDECDTYRDMMDAFSADNDLLCSLLRQAEVEMRYAGWDVRQEDNFTRHQLYQRIQEVLKGD